MGSDRYWEQQNLPPVCTREHVNEADAQALADVRTLDEWAGQNPRRAYACGFIGSVDVWCELRESADGERNSHEIFFCATPDEARAKAAAWVREQGAGT